MDSFVHLFGFLPFKELKEMKTTQQILPQINFLKGGQKVDNTIFIPFFIISCVSLR
jgi:hypothetical protein